MHKFMQFTAFFLCMVACHAQNEGKGTPTTPFEQKADVWYNTPPTATDRLGRGQYFYHKGFFKKAITEFNEALLLDATLADAYLWRGKAKEALKDYSGAINDYNMALYYHPQLYEAHALRAGIRLLHGDTTGACQEWASIPEAQRPRHSPCAKGCQMP